MRYKVEKSATRPNWWVVTDTDNLIVCEFEQQKFNDTQKVTFLDEEAFFRLHKRGAPSEVARLVNEMSEYLREYHYLKVLPEPDKFMRHYVGMKIATERQRQGLSQEDLATLIGVRQTTISRIEGGKWAVSIDMIEQILKALNCTLKIEKEL